MTALHEWQGHRGVTDATMAGALGVSRSTWVRWRDSMEMPHSAMISAVNILDIPLDYATRILMGGYKKFKEK